MPTQRCLYLFVLVLSVAGVRLGQCVLAQGTPPSFTTQPKSTYVLNNAAVNTTLTVDCDVAGDPMPSFVWFRRDGNSYVEVDASFVLENGTLSIPIIMGDLSPHASTEGVSYYCTAMNAFGIIRSQTAEAFVASYGIFQETGPRTVNVSLNSDAALFCDVTGISPPLNPSDPNVPASRIIWYYANGMEAGTEVALSASPRTVDNGKYLVFIELQPADIRSYYCGVFNPMLGTREYNLATLEMVDIGNLGFVIYKELEDVEANLGSRVEFSIVVGYDAKAALYGFRRDGRLAGVANSGPVADIDNVQLGGENDDQVESMITCTVANTDGVERIFNSTLILQDPAKISTKPSNLLDNFAGTAIVISCPFTGLPAPTIEWYYDGVLLAHQPGIAEMAGDMLTLPSPTVEQTGAYQCFVSNTAGVDSASASIAIREKVSPALNMAGGPAGAVFPRGAGGSTLGPVLFAMDGDPITIEWVVVGDPCPTVQWFKDDTLLSELDGPILNETGVFIFNEPCAADANAASFAFTLQVTSVNETTKGMYTATFNNVAATFQAQSVLVTPEQFVVLEPLDAPQCLAAGTNVTLQCVAVGFPLPNITFNFNGAPVELVDSGYSMPFYDTLVISNVQAEHGGSYRCNGKNSVSMDSGPGPSPLSYCTLPEITRFVTFSPSPIDSGEILSLQCSVAGQPVPTITFELDGKPIVAAPPRITITVESAVSTLQIQAVDAADAGTYLCIATNDASRTTDELRIEVNLGTITLSTEAIIGIACGVGGAILLVCFFFIVVFCVFLCAASSTKQAGYTPNVAYGGQDFADSRGNVDRDSDEEEEAQPEPFQPTYASLPLSRPSQPPQYKPTPSYPHGVPNTMSMDDMEMVKVPPPDTDSYLGGTIPRHDNGNMPPYRPTVDDFVSEDAQFV